MDYDPYMFLFSTVFQDFRLFSFSLRDNVSLGMPQDDARVEKALRDAGLDPRTELELYARFNDFARGKTAIYHAPPGQSPFLRQDHRLRERKDSGAGDAGGADEKAGQIL